MSKYIYLTCKLINQDAHYFTRPVADLKDIKQVLVFRDQLGIDYSKVKFITPFVKTISVLNLIIRFFQMIFSSNKGIKLIIGIYEIPHGLLAVLVGKLKKIPSVVCIIGNPAYTPIRKGLRKKFTYLILRHATYVTTTGNNSRNFLIAEGFSPNKIKVLPNSIDVTYFIPSGIEKKYDIITVGRVSSEKQIDVFVETIEKLTKYNKNIKAAIAGIGPEFEIIKDMISNKNLTKNIDMLGFVEGDNLKRLFNQGKVYLSCSQTEGFPRTIIQSLACGTPCVSSNVGDIEDTIKEGYNGFLVEDSNNTDAYVEKILILLNSNETYENFSIKGRNMVCEKYSFEASTLLWNSILKELN
jgi:glycosyltransferase involved in cell wall biosynthesis